MKPTKYRFNPSRISEPIVGASMILAGEMNGVGNGNKDEVR